MTGALPEPEPSASAPLTVRQGELVSVRTAGRELYRLIDELESGAVEKFVLLDQRNVIRAVLMPPPREEQT